MEYDSILFLGEIAEESGRISPFPEILFPPWWSLEPEATSSSSSSSKSRGGYANAATRPLSANSFRVLHPQNTISRKLRKLVILRFIPAKSCGFIPSLKLFALDSYIYSRRWTYF